MEPVDPHYLEAILAVLTGNKVTFFKCEQFSVGFAGEQEEEDDDKVSTDVRGFQADSSDDEDDFSEDKLARQHSRAFGAPMPLLNPIKPKKAAPEKKE